MLKQRTGNWLTLGAVHKATAQVPFMQLDSNSLKLDHNETVQSLWLTHPRQALPYNLFDPCQLCGLQGGMEALDLELVQLLIIQRSILKTAVRLFVLLRDSELHWRLSNAMAGCTIRMQGGMGCDAAHDW